MPTVHSHSVEGDNDGIRALQKLDPKEADVIFDYAEEKKSAEFEGTIEGSRVNFTLHRNPSGGWSIEKRGKEKSKGWFGW